MGVVRSFVLGSLLAFVAFFALGGQKKPLIPTPHAIKPHSQRILIPLPSHGFDPTEFAYPAYVLSSLGYDLLFATPAGQPSSADPIVLSSAIFRPSAAVVQLYDEMRSTPAFLSPITFDELGAVQFDGIVLVGGHHPGMSTFLDDPRVHSAVRKAFDEKKVLGMICHGALAALRTTVSAESSQSILSAVNASFTFLPRFLEQQANFISERIMGLKEYQLSTTHGIYVQDEIENENAQGAPQANAQQPKAATAAGSSAANPKLNLVHSPMDFLAPLLPGSSRDHSHAFVVVDRKNSLVSARFWGDAYLFALWVAELMQTQTHMHNAAGASTASGFSAH